MKQTFYVIINDTIPGFFKRSKSKSLYWSPDDFVETLDQAHTWTNKEKAISKAKELFASVDRNGKKNGWTLRVIEYEYTPTLVDDLCVEFSVQEDIDHAKSIVERVEKLTHEEKEALPDKQWNDYKDAKRTLRIYTR